MMATLTPSPKMQFFDANGNPLVGGKLYTYAAGTTTPLATYTDSTGGTPNTNPVILDSRGEASVWLGSSLYYMELKTSTDVLVWTSDNIGAVATLAALAVSGGSALVGFIQFGSGAVASTIQQKCRETVSVNDFGADATGISDSTTAIVNAISSGGKNIVFQPGTYLVNTGNIQVPSDTRFIFKAGTTLTSNLTGSNLPTTFFLINGSNVEFVDCHASLSSNAATWDATKTKGFFARINANGLDNIRFTGGDIRYFTSTVDCPQTIVGLTNFVVYKLVSVATYCDINIKAIADLANGVQVRNINIDAYFPIQRLWNSGGGSGTPYRHMGNIWVSTGFDINTGKGSARTIFGDTYDGVNAVSNAYTNGYAKDVTINMNSYKPDNRPVFISNAVGVEVTASVEAVAGDKATAGVCNDVVTLEFCRSGVVHNVKTHNGGENSIDILSCKNIKVYGCDDDGSDNVGCLVSIADAYTIDYAGVAGGPYLANMVNRSNLIPENIQIFGNHFRTHYPVLVALGQKILVDNNQLELNKTSTARTATTPPYLYSLLPFGSTLNFITNAGEATTYDKRIFDVVFSNNKTPMSKELNVSTTGTGAAAYFYSGTIPHGFVTGDKVEFFSNKNATTQTFFTLTSGRPLPVSYCYVIKIDAFNFQVATTWANALNGVVDTIATQETAGDTIGVREVQNDITVSSGSNNSIYPQSNDALKLDKSLPLLLYSGAFSGIGTTTADIPPMYNWRIDRVFTPGTNYNNQVQRNLPIELEVPHFYSDGTNTFGARLNKMSSAAQLFNIATYTDHFGGANQPTSEQVRVKVW
jgi:hypothetical protein